MGFPMAGHLADKGHNVTVYNRTTARADDWLAKYTGTKAASPAKAAANQTIVCACVGNDADLREITLGEQGAFQTMGKDTVFIDHTTASAQIARELAKTATKQGFHFLDAPVSGGQAGAENGALSIMCGGDAAAFERVHDTLKCYGKAIRLLGDAGAGQLTKMVNQICIAGLVQGLAEGLAFAERAGLDGTAVVETIEHGAAGSWQMANRGKTMLADQFDFGFAVDWMRKDLAICLDEATRNGAKLDIAKLVDGYYNDLQTMGGGRWDTSALIRRLR